MKLLAATLWRQPQRYYFCFLLSSFRLELRGQNHNAINAKDTTIANERNNTLFVYGKYSLVPH